MSMEHNETIRCPECGKEGQFTIWQSINTDINPEMKSTVRDMSAFTFTCPHCGTTANVDYPVLYHQMEDRMMIYYVNRDEDIESVYKMLKGEDPADELQLLAREGYLNRIVLTRNQLREKLLIFDAGLDDRIIEIMKLFMMASIQKQQQDIEIMELLYDSDEKGASFAVLTEDGNVGSVDFDMGIYDSVKEDIAKAWPDIRDDEIIINTAWAYEKLVKKNE